MHIRSLKLANYRNYEALELPLDERLTVLLGENAQGKTNVLESIYLCAAGRSHRTVHDGELVRFGAEAAYVRVDLVRAGISRRIEFRLPRAGRKQARLDGAPISRMGDLMGCLNAVLFSPGELSLVKEGPGVRRRYLDILLCQTGGAYFYALAAYQKALAQRNALLKELAQKGGDSAQLDVWEEQLERASGPLSAARKEAMDFIAPMAARMHGAISSGREELAVSYRPDLSGPALRQALLDARREDIRRGATSHGPHRDDFLISINGAELRSFGSQGQQRTAALALKLAELFCMEERVGEKPVLLLDDVLSELDETRQGLLMEAVAPFQTILTCTALPRRRNTGAVFQVKNGSLSPRF